MMQNLLSLAAEEGVTLCEQTITTNSRKALLLSEACKPLGADVFYPLHQALFEAYFVEGRNIGDEAVLRDIASAHRIPENIIQQAWSDPYSDGPPDRVPASLLPYLQYAGAIQARSVPTYIIGEQMLAGVVSRDSLLAAARSAQAKHEAPAATDNR
jgi:predicted DsbA family dithiol-disulfide isomerase